MSNFYTDNDRLSRVLRHPQMKEIVDLQENDYQDALSFDIAPKDFEDAIDSYAKTMEVMGEICSEVLAKNAAGVDEEGPRVEDGRVYYASGTAQNHKTLVETGLYGISLPRQYNGLNFPTVLFSMSSELISRADASFDNIWALQNCADIIAQFGSEEQKEMFLHRIAEGATCSMDLTEPDAGSDLQAMSLKANYNEENDTWTLNGVKRFITNGDADIHLVLARSEAGTTDARGLSLFIYDKAWGGLTVRRIEHKLGIVGSPTCELVYDNAPAVLVGSRRMGLIKYVMALMNGARLGIGAQSVGLSEASYRAAYEYAHQRKQFNKLIVEFPAVQDLLSQIQMKLDASREMLYATSRLVDLQNVYTKLSTSRSLTPEERAKLKTVSKKADMFTPILKFLSGEYANENAYDAIQVLGGSGYVKSFPVERYYRDARVLTIYEGTSQMQVVAASKYVGNGLLLKTLQEYREEADALYSDGSYEPACASRAFVEERAKLSGLVDKYESLVNTSMEMGDNAMLSRSRGLVECGGSILMSYLLLLVADDKRSCESFVKYLKHTNGVIAKFEAVL